LKARSFDSLLDVPVEAFYREIEEVLTDKETIAMVQEIVELGSYESVMEKRLDNLIRNKDASEVERMEAARLISIMKPTPGVRQLLGQLLQNSSPEVLNYALDSATVHRLSEHVPLIIPLLGNPMAVSIAQSTLAAYGSGIEDTLAAHLHNATENLQVRNAIPDILARLGNQKATDTLIMELAQGTEGMEQSLIDALYKIRSKWPKMRFNRKKIMAAVFSMISKSYAVYLAGIENQSPDNPSASARDWKPVLDLKIKRTFDLLTLIYPSEDIIKAYQNILQGTRNSVDYSLELLDNVLDRELKLLLFPIIEDLPPEEKARRLRKLEKSLEQRLVSTEIVSRDRVS
jgi:ATP:ADP antiporter, AAA family